MPPLVLIEGVIIAGEAAEDAYALYRAYKTAKALKDAIDAANKLKEGDQTNCGGTCMAADKAPGKPSEADGYKEPKKWDGEKVRNPNGSGAGWPDAKGDVWVPTGEPDAPLSHGGSHWDVQSPGGGYRNVYPGGRVR